LELGGNVRKGEHGTKVYFVKQLQVRDKGADDNSSTRLVPMMREYTVFNVDQCENLPDSVITGKPMRVRNPDTRDELADAFVCQESTIEKTTLRILGSCDFSHSLGQQQTWEPV
jgi:antirestriction protein ArdC